MNRTQKACIKALCGAALLGAVAYFADPAALWARLRAADGRWLLAGLAAAITSNVVSAWRWRALAQWLGAPMRWPDALRWYFQAIGLNALLPGAVVGGDVYRAVVLQRSGQGKAAASLSVLLDRFSGLWMLCAIGAIGAALSATALAPVLHISLLALQVLMVLGVIVWIALPWLLLWWLGQRQAASLPGWLQPLLQAAARPDFNRQMLVQAGSSALVQLLSAAALALGGLALGIHLALAAWAFAMAPIFLMAALPVSVGGWGTREAASAAALAPFGVPAALAVGVGLIYGVYALVQGALGAIAFGLPSRREREADVAS
ncbi:lysylphosphatidylglycerol synthase transmembrane domain-containing protein [Comamonas sp.]|uniref:lysylphosphatidylglycerol synthase transmembrane domain-containing protein n=1 Tax=Comamonas sp. TaxID=34028 RepID=UPI0028A1DEE0|nr:lysylphosphatidylglycerol synthase transmembrane domain-containing protein [Comamonas sp.]